MVMIVVALMKKFLFIIKICQFLRVLYYYLNLHKLDTRSDSQPVSQSVGSEIFSGAQIKSNQIKIVKCIDKKLSTDSKNTK